MHSLRAHYLEFNVHKRHTHTSSHCQHSQPLILGPFAVTSAMYHIVLIRHPVILKLMQVQALTDTTQGWTLEQMVM